MQSLLQACRSGDHGKVQRLLEAKTNVNYKDEVHAHNRSDVAFQLQSTRQAGVWK